MGARARLRVVLTTSQRQWNFADVWEAIASRHGEHPALVHGSLVRSWHGFDTRADGLAATLLDVGLERQEKVAQYCRNRPEYLESMFAAFKAGLVPVNTNFRYGDEELTYLWRDSDTAAVVFDAEFTETCDRLRYQLPEVKAWIRVDEHDGSGECPDWAIPYEVAVTSASDDAPTRAPWGRSGADLNLLYTGGTTGMPKGVMWPQHDFFMMIERRRTSPPPAAETSGRGRGSSRDHRSCTGRPVGSRWQHCRQPAPS
jgi:acyl-CoA synthetase (AMP-forming)/AMP-acid ligase II